MRSGSSKSSKHLQANLMCKSCLAESGSHLLKSSLLYVGCTLSLAIGLSALAATAEEQQSVVTNPTIDLTPPSSLDPATQPSNLADFDSSISKQKLDNSFTLGLVTDSKEFVHPRQSIKQAASLLSEAPARSPQFKASPFSPNAIAQTDVSPPPPSESPSESAPSNSLVATSNDRWRFSVAPYFFVPLRVQVDGTVAGRSASIDLGLGSILNFDRAFDAGLRVEAWRNRWGVIFDGFYVSAKNSGNLGVTLPAGTLQSFGINSAIRVNADASLAVRQGTVDVAASYRVVDTSLSRPAVSNSFPRLVVAPILGVRTNILWQKLEVDNIRIGNIPLPFNQDVSFSKTFVEPMVGAQIGLDLSDRWAVGMRGDVSGFGVSADQNLTWNLLVGTQYHLSPSTSLQLGYRFNNFDFEDGSGLRRTRVNLSQNGLLLSVLFRF